MNNEQLRKSVERQVKRMQRAQQDRPTLLAQSIFLGTLSLLFILPILVGVYLGNWLDDRAQGYSVHWPIGLLILGIIVGMGNVYLYVRKHD